MQRQKKVWLAAAMTVGLVAAMPSPASAAVAAGDVHAFGSDASGQLGNGGASPHVDKGPAILAGASDVAGGREHALALVGGRVFAWGSDLHGQVGNGSPLVNETAPAVAVSSGATAVTTGHYHSLALMAGGGEVAAWGWNNRGQIGLATGFNISAPRDINFPGSAVVQVAAGRAHSIARRADGTVWTWGDNTFGQLGYGRTDTSKHPTPTKVDGLPSIKFVAGGRDTTFAVATNGDLWVWGNNTYGQAGTGSTTAVLTPQRITTLSDVSLVESGADHTVAVTNGGAVYTWGRNRYGQLGYDGTANRTTPTPVGGLPDISEVFAGRDHSIAVTGGGAYYTWGRNDGGQLGPNAPLKVSSPLLVSDLAGTRDAGGGQVYTVVLG